MKWVVLALLWVAYFLLQAMRQVYNASLPQIRADFAAAGATAVSLGLVGTVFYFVYGLCAPCASVVADVFRRKAVIVAGCLLFSVGVFASGCAGTLAMIVLSYGVVNALGQSMVPASSSAVISEWHEKTRATALSIYQVANYAGIILAALLAGGVGARGAGAWRWAFWILGGFGLVWAGVLAACLRTQPAAEAGRREAPRPAAARAEKPSVRAALASVLGSPVALLLTLAFGFTMYGDNGYKVWMTTYLKDAFAATTPASAAFHAVFWFYLGAVAGIAAAGRLSDRLAPCRPAARFEVALAGLVLSAPCVVLAVRARTLAGACAALAAWGFARGIYDSNFFASLHDVVAPRCRAAATGLFCCGGFVLGSFAPAVLGWIAERASMAAGMRSLGWFYLAGGLTILVARHLFMRRPTPGSAPAARP